MTNKTFKVIINQKSWISGKIILAFYFWYIINRMLGKNKIKLMGLTFNQKSWISGKTMMLFCFCYIIKGIALSKIKLLRLLLTRKVEFDKKNKLLSCFCHTIKEIIWKNKIKLMGLIINQKSWILEKYHILLHMLITRKFFSYIKKESISAFLFFFLFLFFW